MNTEERSPISHQQQRVESFRTGHLNVQRDRSGRIGAHQSVSGGESRASECRRYTEDDEGRKATVVRNMVRKFTGWLLSFVLSQLSSVVSHQSSPLPAGGPHYDPNSRDDNDREPGGGGLCIAGNTRVASASARQPGEGKTGSDGSEIQGTQPLRGEVGSGREGATKPPPIE